MSAGAAPQLVVDPPALVAVGADDVEAAERRHLVAPRLVLAPQPDVGAAPGHVGRDRHGPRRARLGDDRGLGFVVLRVEHAADDARRAEPVTAQTLAQEKATAYLTGGALYILQPGGKVEVYDFSKVPTTETRVFDAKFYRELARDLGLVLYPLGFAAAFAIFMVWKLVSTLFYSLIALVVNGVAEAGLEFKPLFILSVYAQTLVIVVQCILLLVPAQVPQFTLLSAVATTVYLWLAIKRLAPPPPQAAA